MARYSRYSNHGSKPFPEYSILPNNWLIIYEAISKGRAGNDHLPDLVNFSSSFALKCLISEKMIPKRLLRLGMFWFWLRTWLWCNCNCARWRQTVSLSLSMYFTLSLSRQLSLSLSFLQLQLLVVCARWRWTARNCSVTLCHLIFRWPHFSFGTHTDCASHHQSVACHLQLLSVICQPCNYYYSHSLSRDMWTLL